MTKCLNIICCKISNFFNKYICKCCIFVHYSKKNKVDDILQAFELKNNINNDDRKLNILSVTKNTIKQNIQDKNHIDSENICIDVVSQEHKNNGVNDDKNNEVNKEENNQEYDDINDEENNQEYDDINDEENNQEYDDINDEENNEENDKENIEVNNEINNNVNDEEWVDINNLE
jgi:hypothetical protein